MKSGNKNHKRVSLFIHITGWGLIFGLPLLFSDHSSPDYFRHYLWFSLIPLALLTVFYVNYTLLIDKFLFKRKSMAYFLIFNTFLITGVSLILFAVRHYYIDVNLASTAARNCHTGLLRIFSSGHGSSYTGRRYEHCRKNDKPIYFHRERTRNGRKRKSRSRTENTEKSNQSSFPFQYPQQYIFTHRPISGKSPAGSHRTQ